jgi:hypothetical protein
VRGSFDEQLLLSAVAQSTFKAADVQRVLRRLLAAAEWTDADGKSDVRAIELFLKYTIGPPRRSGAALRAVLDVTAIRTVDDCIGAAAQILALEADGVIDREQAASYQASVRLMLDAIRSKGETPDAPPQINVSVQVYDAPDSSEPPT